MAVECGFELLGVEDDFVEDVSDEVGFDYMELLKGGAGMLSGAGGLMSGGGSGAAAQPTAAQVQLQMQKEAAEKSASNMKIGMIVLAVLLGLVGIFALARGGGAAPAAVK